MDRARVQGGVIAAVIATAIVGVFVGFAGRADLPAVLALVFVIGVPVGIYLWPTITFLRDFYRQRGYTLAPTGLRVAQAFLLGVAGLLIRLLFLRLGGDDVTLGELGLAWLFGFAVMYLVWTRQAAEATGRATPPVASRLITNSLSRERTR